MSAIEEDVSSPLADGQSVFDRTLTKATNHDLLVISGQNADEEAGQGDKAGTSEPTTPKLHPMAFTIDFGEGKVDKSKLEELAKKSQARHQRVQSMSASMTRPSPIAQKTPMSAKLPRKAQGYHSEGYFSSDQEDSILSGSIKLRQSPLAQNADKTHIVSPGPQRSPIHDRFFPHKASKSPIVDSIMSRSEILPSRPLNLPLKNPNNAYRDVHRTTSYGNLNYRPRSTMDIIDQSPDGLMLTDISSPDLDILTPDNGVITPEYVRSPVRNLRRAISETPDLLFNTCGPKNDGLFIGEDEVDRQSNDSSTGTYTIEGHNYTEEQKARMSIDRTFGAQMHDKAIADSLKKRSERKDRDPELVYNFDQRVSKEPRKESVRFPPPLNLTFNSPNKVAKDKNVLEISCCYESPTENDLAAQTSKQIKSTRSYLEKIKNRVKTITEKSFPKPTKPIENADLGSFTAVTTSGVLSTKYTPKVEFHEYHNERRCSLTKSEIDQTNYIHRQRETSVPPTQPEYMNRLTRESSVPVNLPSNKLPFDSTKFESTALRNAHKALRDDSGISSDITPDQVVGKLSYLSLNRCKGDKTWIEEWAESVKKYNNNTLAASEQDLNGTYMVDSDRPPISPRRDNAGKSPRHPFSSCVSPTKIPSPVGTLHRRMAPDLIPSNQDTAAYLQKTQNAITNLQAKLHNSTYIIPPALTSSLISEKTAASKLPVSQLSRSNSLNYRLRRKDKSNDSSPLRSPGNYVITGSSKIPESTKLLNTRSLDTDKRKFDSNMNSPCSDRGLSNSSDDKTLSHNVEAILSPHRKHLRNRSGDGRNVIDGFNDVHNANSTISLKTVLKNNAETQKLYAKIDQIGRQGDAKRSHQRGYSDSIDPLKTYSPSNYNFGNSIKRSSSFNTVTGNNNYLEPRFNRRSSGHDNEVDYLSDDSDTYDKTQGRYRRTNLRGRIDSPDLKSIAPANSPSRKCPNTPELSRKFWPGLVRNSVRVTSKERALNSRMSEPPVTRDERPKQVGHQSRRISEPTRQAVMNRLTKSRSSTREFQPKLQDKGSKKPAQHRSSSALASKEVAKEFSNWKKRSSYDPMKAAQEGRRRQQMAKRNECNKDDLSSPSHSSPVHRSQSFHTTNMADLDILDTLDALDYSSGSEHPLDNPMVTSTHSDILDVRRTADLRRKAINSDVTIQRDMGTSFQVNQPLEKLRRRPDSDKRRTFILDDVTPTKENVDLLRSDADKRKTFILDSDTNSTTNGSSPRTSSIYSHEKTSLTTASDSEDAGDSGGEARRRGAGARGPAHPKHRYSGDYSMSSSTTSITQPNQQGQPKRPIQPRYLDISKYKNESSKTFLRRDPSKTYVGVLNHGERAGSVSKGSAQQYEMEQKKQELEKWRRRASYDPRRAAALAKGKTTTQTASSVLRSQSFHGPMLAPVRYQPAPAPVHLVEYDNNSDNDF